MIIILHYLSGILLIFISFSSFSELFIFFSHSFFWNTFFCLLTLSDFLLVSLDSVEELFS